MKKKADLIITAGQVITCAPGGSPKRGASMKEVGLMSPCTVAITGESVLDIGSPEVIERDYTCDDAHRIDVPEGIVLPGLVDAHTHPIFAGSRINEYVMRARGATYLEIAEAGGGILSTVRATRGAADEELNNRLMTTLNRMLLHGTTTIEAKSGYGLNEEEELRQLRLLREAEKIHPIEMARTFLGAHTVPEEYKGKRGEYIEKLRKEMLPRVAREKLAEFVDVFCEKSAFTVEETREIFEVSQNLGLDLKVHAEQFTPLGSSAMAAEMGAASCDHLLQLEKQHMEVISRTNTVAVFMPGTELFLGIHEYGPVREAIEAGVAVAIGTDFNAGSCLSESMPMAMSLALLGMKMEPEEVINAATVNAAHSMRRGDRLGSIEPGKQADLLILDIPDYREWLYHFGVNMVHTVIKRGRIVVQSRSIIEME
ncbi:MAG: imidazolonepropionase [Candidatus Xenobiia bacterium LiM19]